MNKLLHNLMLATSITLLSASFASAAKVNIKVKNTEENSTSNMTWMGYLSPAGQNHQDFPAKSGENHLTVPNAKYGVFNIDFQGKETICYAHQEGGYLHNIDLDGNKKSIDLIVTHDQTTGKTECYKAGG
jgi:hypothetical protein